MFVMRLTPAPTQNSNEYMGDGCNESKLSEIDNWLEWIISICNALGSSYEFHVSGFGQEMWPVDVHTDLAVVLEQIPTVLPAIKRGSEEFILDFYEQGIERVIEFRQRPDWVTATCKSSAQWQPQTHEIIISTVQLEAIFDDLIRDVCKAIEETIPEHTNSRHFKYLCNERSA